MNWLSGGKSGPQTSIGASTAGGPTGNDQEQQMRMLAELEIELTADMYQRCDWWMILQLLKYFIFRILLNNVYL